MGLAYLETPKKMPHIHSSADSAKTQTKRRQADFEHTPDGTSYYISGQSTSAQRSKKQHKATAKEMIENFNRQFNSHS
ncbi:hypothetical protein CKAH01_12022 [Colletotrichum kahawae]|uniref:Uncharacterized protein n=1 Tax=Colletotrichum kahawae TaxID=34407 RepID=A0AAD9YWG0_COLKA|nr:hypothetical protein CKAH01_12022 [Colletotrichum kahawae]